MGVLACSRQDCEEIMCNFYSDKYGYLCDDCRDDLIKMGPMSVYAFLATPKEPTFVSEVWGEYVVKEFKSRYD